MASALSELRHVSIFSMFDDSELDAVSRILNAETIPKGTVLFEEGDAGSELFIVRSGCIGSSIRLPDGTAREIAVFQSGDFFGEMSIFESAPRSATCYAKEKSVVQRLNEADFFTFLQANPTIAIKLMYRMLNITVQRLEKTGAFLSDMVTWGEEARRRAVTDEMTGVYNRRFLEDVIVDHFRAAQREGTPLSLIMVDLDRFREINERYGKEMGDRVILEALKVFRTHLRETDIIARYGGDEFTVMLPSTSLSEAQELAERICRDVRDLPLLKDSRSGKIDRVTTSQGVASFPECAGDLKTLRVVADEALYRAKEAGKDRVACAPAQDGDKR